MTIREGKWKCTYCDALNRGGDLKCAGCSATREQDVEFIDDESAPEVTGEAELRAARSGPEWLCETCGTSNEAAREVCRQCGAPRGSSRSREVGMVGDRAAPPPPPAPKRFPTKITAALAALVAVLGVFVIGVIALAFYLTRTHEAQLTVTGVRWERSIEVEELQTLTEQAWENELPSDARVISRRREFHHNDKIQTGTRRVEQTSTERVQTGTKRVKVGTKNLGNGYFEDVYKDEPVYENRKRTRMVDEPVYRDEPVYKNRVTYQVDRWKTVGTERAQKDDISPVWPGVQTGPKRRAGRRAEKYLVLLRDSKSGETYEREVAEGEFVRFVPGSTCRAEINNLGTIVKLVPPGSSP